MNENYEPCELWISYCGDGVGKDASWPFPESCIVIRTATVYITYYSLV